MKAHPKDLPFEQWPILEKIDWVNTLFLIITPLIVLTWLPIHIYFYGLKVELLVFFVIYSVFTSLSITAGYHRLFAHKSYQANPIVKFLFLIFGSAAFQGSALKWCSDHRRHHKYVDTNLDPYSIKKGLFFAHVGWVLIKENPQKKFLFESDLAKDPLVAWQNKYNVPISIAIGFGIPMLVGWALGSAVGGLLYAGILRVVVTQHFTFFINSFCHYFGRQPFSEDNTARDSWFLALFTYGEGYHNFHHKFQGDYRNGIRWFDWDPTKWVIRSLGFLGLTKQHRRIPSTEILKARLEIQQQKLLQRGAPQERLTVLMDRVHEAQKSIRQLKEEYKNSLQSSSREQLVRLRTEIRLARLEFNSTYRQWGAYYRMWKKHPAYNNLNIYN